MSGKVFVGWFEGIQKWWDILRLQWSMLYLSENIWNHLDYVISSHWLSVLFECTARTSRDAGTLGNVIIVEQAASVVWAASSCTYTVSAFQCNRRGLKENCGSGKINWPFDNIRSYSMIHVAPGLGWQYLTCNMAMNYLLTKYYCLPTYYKRDTLLAEWGSANGKNGFLSLWRENIRLRLWLGLSYPSGARAVWPQPLSITSKSYNNKLKNH